MTLVAAVRIGATKLGKAQTQIVAPTKLVLRVAVIVTDDPVGWFSMKQPVPPDVKFDPITDAEFPAIVAETRVELLPPENAPIET